jgi:hypothetical protein
MEQNNKGQFDFKKLVDEAARETYLPRAKRCWFGFHDWTMWESDPGLRSQQ